MHRIPRKTDFGRNLTPWPGMAWEVLLKLNSRQSVTEIHCMATLSREGKRDQIHSVSRPIAPFDDLRGEIIDALLEATIFVGTVAKNEDDEGPDYVCLTFR